MPLPQFWSFCFFLMLILLAVDSHVITVIMQLIDQIRCLLNTRTLTLSPVCGCGEFYHHGERYVSKVAPQTNETWDLCPGSLCICLPHTSLACNWGMFQQENKPIPQLRKHEWSRSTPWVFTRFCLFQGGIYIFQFFDYYASSRICGNFIAICECLALGWMFGETKWPQHSILMIKMVPYISFIPVVSNTCIFTVNFQQGPIASTPSSRTWREANHQFSSKSAGNISFLLCH